jgi:hypothetical protein
MACTPRQFRAFGAPATWLALAMGACQACHIDVTPIPVEAEDAAIHEAVTDGGTVENAPTPPAKHPACDEPLPEPLPESPPVATTPGGRPEFDQFLELDCDQFQDQASCTADDRAPFACARCLSAREDTAPERAVCVPLAQRGCIVVAHGGGCLSCVAPEAKARACCLGLDIDCRPWPFDAGSGPGELCARHDDCQPGLLCKALPEERRFGLCTCPERAPPLAPALNECLWEPAP